MRMSGLSGEAPHAIKPASRSQRRVRGGRGTAVDPLHAGAAGPDGSEDGGPNDDVAAVTHFIHSQVSTNSSSELLPQHSRSFDFVAELVIGLVDAHHGAGAGGEAAVGVEADSP